MGRLTEVRRAPSCRGAMQHEQFYPARPCGGVDLDRRPEPYAGRVRAPEFPPDADWIGSPPVRLADARGRVVLLDFWTSGCINCIHIVPALHRLQVRFADDLWIIGVHTPKFPAEKDPDRLALAVDRLGIEHPVVADPDYRIWQSFAVDAWPTLIFLDPDGRVAARQPGEFDVDLVAAFVERLLGDREIVPGVAEGSADPPPVIGEATRLRFPGKVAVGEGGDRLFVSDSGNDRIVVMEMDGTIRDVIGSSRPGDADGSFEHASFRNPQGLALAPDGETAIVADAGNHLLRHVDLRRRTVETVGGTGVRGFAHRGGNARATAIASPWDVVWFEGRYLVAMAGMHQIWAYDPGKDWLEPFAGSGIESIHDDRLPEATFAQPMGITALGQTIYVADSESSAAREIDVDRGRVRRIVGRGLFHFGDVDAIGDSVRLQHPQGIVAEIEAGRPVLYVADTFNNKIKRLDPARREVATIAGTGEQGFADGDALDAEFREPCGLALEGGNLYIADTQNHAVRRLDLTRGLVETVTVR